MTMAELAINHPLHRDGSGICCVFHMSFSTCLGSLYRSNVHMCDRARGMVKNIYSLFVNMCSIHLHPGWGHAQYWWRELSPWFGTVVPSLETLTFRSSCGASTQSANHNTATICAD